MTTETKTAARAMLKAREAKMGALIGKAVGLKLELTCRGLTEDGAAEYTVCAAGRPDWSKVLAFFGKAATVTEQAYCDELDESFLYLELRHDETK